MDRHASSGAVLADAARPYPDDATLITRWDAASRPPVPVFANRDGQVVICVGDVPGLFARRGLHWAIVQHRAADWIDHHCPG